MTQDPGTKLGRLKLYAPLVFQVATAAGERPSRVLALGYRESWLGYAPGYLPKGDPAGRGDNGNGCGLFQIDARYHRAFVEDPVFADPGAQCAYACSLLAANRRHLLTKFPSIELGDYLESGVYAAYNASMLRVQAVMTIGLDPDRVTTGKDYSRYIFTLAAVLERSYPELVLPGE